MADVNGKTGELFRYINLKLAALGQPASRSTTDPYFLEIAGPLLRNYHQKDQLLGKLLCPADTRIQTFLNDYLKDVCPNGAPQLPADSFVLDRPGPLRANIDETILPCRLFFGQTILPVSALCLV